MKIVRLYVAVPLESEKEFFGLFNEAMDGGFNRVGFFSDDIPGWYFRGWATEELASYISIKYKTEILDESH